MDVRCKGRSVHGPFGPSKHGTSDPITPVARSARSARNVEPPVSSSKNRWILGEPTGGHHRHFDGGAWRRMANAQGVACRISNSTFHASRIRGVTWLFSGPPMHLVQRPRHDRSHRHVSHRSHPLLRSPLRYRKRWRPGAECASARGKFHLPGSHLV